MKDFGLLEKKLNLKFKNKNLLIQAFTHRSYLNEHPDFIVEHNERLEFLGDAVLELVVTEYLFKNYPKRKEGELSWWRAALVNSEFLAEIARELNFSDFLLLSRGEAKETGKGKVSILANTFEAFIGALYLDQGYQKVKSFIKKNLMVKLPEIIKNNLYKNAKSQLQELIQEKINITPIYKVLNEWGPDHCKHFTVGVFLENKLIGKGEGSSKQEGEIKAAKDALERKGWIKNFN